MTKKKEEDLQSKVATAYESTSLYITKQGAEWQAIITGVLLDHDWKITDDNIDKITKSLYDSFIEKIKKDLKLKKGVDLDEDVLADMVYDNTRMTVDQIKRIIQAGKDKPGGVKQVFQDLSSKLGDALNRDQQDQWGKFGVKYGHDEKHREALFGYWGIKANTKIMNTGNIGNYGFMKHNRRLSASEDLEDEHRPDYVA